LQEFVDAANDVGDDRRRRVENAALHAFLRIVLLEETLVEVDDRVFVAVAVTEVADDGLHIRRIEQLHNLADSEFVEINTIPSPFIPLSSSEVQEGLHQLLEERVGNRDVRSDGVGGVVCGMRYSGGEQTVGDGLRIHVRKGVCGQIVDEGLLEGLHELRERPALRLNRQDCLNAIANGSGQARQPNSELLRSGDDFAVAQREGRPPLLAPACGVLVIFGPGKPLVEGVRDIA